MDEVINVSFPSLSLYIREKHTSCFQELVVTKIVPSCKGGFMFTIWGSRQQCIIQGAMSWLPLRHAAARLVAGEGFWGRAW